MVKSKYSYDGECARLAAHFLIDESVATDDDMRDLAQYIQEAIEDWLRANIDDRPVPSAPSAG